MAQRDQEDFWADEGYYGDETWFQHGDSPDDLGCLVGTHVGPANEPGPDEPADLKAIIAIRDYGSGTNAVEAASRIYAAGFRFFRYAATGTTIRTIEMDESQTIELFRDCLDISAQETWRKISNRGWQIRREVGA